MMTNSTILEYNTQLKKTADPLTEPRDAEQEHLKQEEVLKRFRMHECNLLIATSVLEGGYGTAKV